VNDARISHSDDGFLPSSEIMNDTARHGALKSVDTVAVSYTDHGINSGNGFRPITVYIRRWYSRRTVQC